MRNEESWLLTVYWEQEKCYKRRWDEMEIKRKQRNLILFIISYVINNLASGVLYDTYVNYLQEVQLSIATSFWAFYGYATFISAALLLLVSKIGYKKLLMFCSLGTAAAYFAAVFMNNPWVLYVATLLALTGVQLHFIMLGPFVAAYTDNLGGKEINWYTRTYYMGYVGYFLATYLGGAAVVKAFSVIAKIPSYHTAQVATRNIADMSAEMRQAYVQGNQVVLGIVGVITLLSVVPVLLIREKKEDCRTLETEEKLTWKEKIKGTGELLLNRFARAYLIYWALISFAMGLFTSYYTVYLNRNLHIDKATSSLIVSISYIAIVVFMLFTPKCTEKLGKVGTIFFTVMASIPFMLIIANGNRFGTFVVPVVGAALFIRAGLANLSSPVDSALSMDVVPKGLRPVFTSLVNFLAGIVSILSGHFTGSYLFVTQTGYQTAYYIAAVLYALAGITLFVGLYSYNHKEDQIVKETKGEKE